MQIERGTISEKAFVFFTKKYRDRYPVRWWYHVAPQLRVQNMLDPFVVDATYTSGPLTVEQWAKSFAPQSGPCARVQNFEEVDPLNNQVDCVFIQSSLYHYYPADLRSDRRLSNWRCSDFQEIIKKLRAPFGKRWSDYPQFIPQYCL